MEPFVGCRCPGWRAVLRTLSSRWVVDGDTHQHIRASCRHRAGRNFEGPGVQGLAGAHRLIAAGHLTKPLLLRAAGGLEGEREARRKFKEAEAEADRRNFESMQKIRQEGFRKVSARQRAPALLS